MARPSLSLARPHPPEHEADDSLPQIVDHDRRGVKIWESGAIYLYLAKHYDTLYALHFEDDDEEDEMVSFDLGVGSLSRPSTFADLSAPSSFLQHSWLFLANAGLAGKGGTIWELFYAEPKSPAAARATIAELKRLYGVYEARLAEHGGRNYLVGAGKGTVSYADLVSLAGLAFASNFDSSLVCRARLLPTKLSLRGVSFKAYLLFYTSLNRPPTPGSAPPPSTRASLHSPKPAFLTSPPGWLVSTLARV